MEVKHSIKAVAKITGIKPVLIRAWERRYNAIIPERTKTNRRLYSDSDITRLSLFKQAIGAGEKISNIAGLSNDQLRKHILVDTSSERANESVFNDRAPEYLESCLEAVRKFDHENLESLLLKGSVSLSLPILLEKLIGPLLQEIGKMWRDGTIKIAQEHQASVVIRTFLGNTLNSHQPRNSFKTIVSCAPSGQQHELGALLVAISAASQNWRSIFLAGDLPAEDIVAAVAGNKASALALSIVYPPDDPRLENELRRIRDLLGNSIPIIIGGRSAFGYNDMISKINGVLVANLGEFRDYLDTLRALS
jgi:MerR family transcriptional regulator, light-induced transcriptional regulator